MQFLRTCVVVAALSTSVYSAQASSVMLQQPQNSLAFTTQQPFAAFTRFEDVWIIFADEQAMEVSLSETQKQQLGITAIEELRTSAGNGLRLRFNKQPRIVLTEENGVLSFTEGTLSQQFSTPKEMGLISLDSGAYFNGLSQENFIQAHSADTGETYTVLTHDGLQPNGRGSVMAGLRFLPSLSGMVFVSRNGSALDVSSNKEQVLIEPVRKGVGRIFVDKTPTDFDPVKFLNRSLAEINAIAPATEEVSGTAFDRAMYGLNSARGNIDEVALVKRRESASMLRKLFKAEDEHIEAQRVDVDEPGVSQEKPLGDFDFVAEGAELDDVDVATLSKEDMLARMEKRRDNRNRLEGLGESEVEAQVLQKKEKLEDDEGERKWDDADFFAYEGDQLPPRELFSEQQAPITGIGDAPSVDFEEALDPFSGASEAEQTIADLLEDAPDPSVHGQFLPLFDGLLDEANPYLEYERYYMTKLHKAKNAEGRNFVRLVLAKLSLAFERYRQAEGILLQLPQNLGGVPINQEAQILLGVSRIMQGDTAGALPLLTRETEPENDRKLWLAFAQELTNKPEEALTAYKNFIEESIDYPIHLQQALRLSRARGFLAAGKLKKLDSAFGDISKLYPDGELPPNVKYVKAKARIVEGKDEAGEVLLAEVANSDDLNIAYDAQYDFVEHLLKRGELSRDTAIQYMEDLRFLWRGGELEQQILKRLGQLYFVDGDKRKALERLKYRTIYFPEAKDATEVAEYMTNEFRDIFFGDEVGSLDPLFVLGLYYDFRELTPPGKSGDELIRAVARRLQGLGLFQRAVKLLEHQMRYRVKDPVEKASYGALLAELYLRDNNYEKGLKALDDSDSRKLPKKLRDQRKVMEGQLLVALGEFEAARKLLAQVKNQQSFDLQVDLAWGQDQFEDMITLLEPRFADKEKRKREWTSHDQIYLLRLAFAYNITGNRSKLMQLETNYASKSLSNIVQQPMAFLNADMQLQHSAKLDPNRPWAKVTDAINNYNDLQLKYDSYRMGREDEKKIRKFYNRRLGQTSAPSTKNLDSIKDE